MSGIPLGKSLWASVLPLNETSAQEMLLIWASEYNGPAFFMVLHAEVMMIRQEIRLSFIFICSGVGVFFKILQWGFVSDGFKAPVKVRQVVKAAFVADLVDTVSVLD